MVLFLYNDIFSLLQQILQTVVKPGVLINCKDFGDLMKLDLDKINTFMKLKDMNIGFSTISTITKLKETDQINNCSDFIFIQWCYLIRFNYCKNTF